MTYSLGGVASLTAIHENIFHEMSKTNDPRIFLPQHKPATVEPVEREFLKIYVTFLRVSLPVRCKQECDI